MSHSFKLVIDGYLFKLAQLAIKLSIDLNIDLNRTVIGVDKARKEIQALSVNPFLDQFYGLQFTYRFNDSDPYMNKIYRQDYELLEEDFPYKQQVLFSFPNDINIDQGNAFLSPLFKIISSLEEESVHHSLFIYLGPDKSEIIYMKKEGKILVNQSCSGLFGGDLIKMSKSYLVSKTKPIV